MPKREPSAEDVLRYLGRKAEHAIMLLGDAVENRDLPPLGNLSKDAYNAVWLLRNLEEEFRLSEEWQRAINDLWKELEILRSMATEIMRRARFVPNA